MNRKIKKENCIKELEEAGEFRKAQTFCFLEAFTFLKVGEDQDFNALIRSIPTEGVTARIMYVFLELLSEHDKETFDTLRDKDGKFEAKNISGLIDSMVKDGIKKNADEEESKRHRCFISALWNVKKDLFGEANLFKEILDSESMENLAKRNGLSKAAAAMVLIELLDNRQNFLITRDAARNFAALERLSSLDFDSLFEAARERSSLLEKRSLYDEKQNLLPFVRAAVFKSSGELFREIEAREFPADIHALKELAAANKSCVDVVKKLIAAGNSSPFVAVYSDNSEDKERIKNLLSYVCREAGRMLFTINPKAAQKGFPLNDAMAYAEAVNGALYLDETFPLSKIGKETIKCPVFTDANPFKKERAESGMRFDSEREADSICGQRNELNAVGKAATFLWEFKTPANSDYLLNCRRFLKENGATPKAANILSALCFKYRIAASEWRTWRESSTRTERFP